MKKEEIIKKLKLLKESIEEFEKLDKSKGPQNEKPKVKKIGTLKDDRRIFKNTQS